MTATAFRYFGPDTGLSADFDARLGRRVDRAILRMTEAEHYRFCDLVADNAHRPLDIATCLALNELMPGWQRFRKDLTWDGKPC